MLCCSTLTNVHDALRPGSPGPDSRSGVCSGVGSALGIERLTQSNQGGKHLAYFDAHAKGAWNWEGNHCPGPEVLPLPPLPPV